MDWHCVNVLVDLLGLASSGRCEGYIALIAIEYQRVIDGILSSLRGRDQGTP